MNLRGSLVNIVSHQKKLPEKPTITGYSVCLNGEIEFVAIEIRNMLSSEEKQQYEQIQSVYED